MDKFFIAHLWSKQSWFWPGSAVAKWDFLCNCFFLHPEGWASQTRSWAKKQLVGPSVAAIWAWPREERSSSLKHQIKVGPGSYSKVEVRDGLGGKHGDKDQKRERTESLVTTKACSSSPWLYLGLPKHPWSFAIKKTIVSRHKMGNLNTDGEDSNVLLLSIKITSFAP